MAKKTNQDETVLDVEELYSKSEKFVDDNKKQLSLGLGAVAAVILVVIGYSSLIVAPKNQAAEEASFMAEHYFSKDSADLAMLGDGLSAGLHEGLYASCLIVQIGIRSDENDHRMQICVCDLIERQLSICHLETTVWCTSHLGKIDVSSARSILCKGFHSGLITNHHLRRIAKVNFNQSNFRREPLIGKQGRLTCVGD